MTSEERNKEQEFINKLKDEVKRYLDITWADEDTEKDVDEYIEEAKQYLNDTTGSNINFEEDRSARELLKNYCRYQKNKDIEFFEDNFAKKLHALRFKYAIKDMESDQDEN